MNAIQNKCNGKVSVLCKIIINLSNKRFKSFMEAKNTMKTDKNIKFLFKTDKFNKPNMNLSIEINPIGHDHINPSNKHTCKHKSMK